MKHKIIFLIVALFAFAAPLQAETINQVAAVVNDQIITTFQVQKEIRKAGVTGPQVQKQALDHLIEKALIQQRVKELGISASDEELEAAIQDVQTQNRISREDLKAALEAQGMSFEEYKDTLRDQIVRFKLMGREVKNKVEVTDEEVRAYFRENIDEFRQAPTVTLTRLSFPFIATGADAARQKAQDVRKRLMSGETVSQVLKEYPATEKDELGTFKIEDLNRDFAQAIDGLAQGEASPPLESGSEVQLLYVTGYAPGSIRHYDTVKDEITQRLQEEKSQDKLTSWSEDLKKDAYIDIRI